MAQRVPKLAKPVFRRDVNPWLEWMREKMLFSRRKAPFDKMELINANRWPEEMSTHSPPDPALPGGVHHKLSANAYAERDGRRSVAPPTDIVADALKMIGNNEVKYVSKGPAENFGLKMPTPGVGFQWQRNKATEQPHTLNDPTFVTLEKYDKYAANKR